MPVFRGGRKTERKVEEEGKVQLQHCGALKIEASEDWLVFLKEDSIASDGQMVDIDAKLRGLGKT